VRRVYRYRYQPALPLLVMGGAALLLTAAMLTFFYLEPGPPSLAQELLEQALAGLEEADREYDLIIEEKGSGYCLQFQGKWEGGSRLTGLLPEYELEAYLKGETLFLRKSGSEDWKTAEALKLQGLESFLVDPVRLLKKEEERFSQALLGEEVDIGGTLCQTAYLKLEEKELLRMLFPEVSLEAVEEATLGVALATPAMTFKQLRIQLLFSGGGGKLERVYYFN